MQNEQVYGAGMRTFLIRQEGARAPPCGAHGSVEPISRERSEREAPRNLHNSADTVSKFSLSFLFFSPLLYSPGLPWGIPWQGNLLPKAPPSAANPLAMTLLPTPGAPASTTPRISVFRSPPAVRPGSSYVPEWLGTRLTIL